MEELDASHPSIIVARDSLQASKPRSKLQNLIVHSKVQGGSIPRTYLHGSCPSVSVNSFPDIGGIPPPLREARLKKWRNIYKIIIRLHDIPTGPRLTLPAEHWGSDLASEPLAHSLSFAPLA